MEGSVFLPLPQGLLITEVCQEGTGLLMKVRSELMSARCHQPLPNATPWARETRP
jgi:hypothetical protein